MLYRNVHVGARVVVHLNDFPNSTLIGTVRYKGGVVLQKGAWIGVELDESVNGHSGLYWGRRYFECRDGHGVFVKSAALDFLPSPRKYHVQ
jgi:dynactin 1